MPTLSFHLDEHDGAKRLLLQGAVTEADVLDDLLLPAAQVKEIDLSGVEYMTSFGVREWIRFVQKLGAREDLSIERCPPPIVHQINRIQGFMGSLRIGSVLVPYLCDRCDKTQLLPARLHPAPELQATVPCACGATANLDELQGSYLAFVSAQKTTNEGLLIEASKSAPGPSPPEDHFGPLEGATSPRADLKGLLMEASKSTLRSSPTQVHQSDPQGATSPAPPQRPQSKGERGK